MTPLSPSKRWTLRSLLGHTYPTTPRNTHPSTLRSLCNAGLIAAVERITQHDNGESRRMMGYIVTRKGERVGEDL